MLTAIKVGGNLIQNFVKGALASIAHIGSDLNYDDIRLQNRFWLYVRSPLYLRASLGV